MGKSSYMSLVGDEGEAMIEIPKINWSCLSVKGAIILSAGADVLVQGHWPEKHQKLSSGVLGDMTEFLTQNFNGFASKDGANLHRRKSQTTHPYLCF